MDALATVLLRRRRRVYLPSYDGGRLAGDEEWVRVVETDLAERGWLLDCAARKRLSGLDRVARTQWADWLLASADHAVGADRRHTPLFLSFPDTPRNVDQLFVERVLAHLFQQDDVRCVLCGAAGTVEWVDPCGHLVCRQCFNPAQYSACPICGRQAAGAVALAAMAPRPPGSPLRLSVVALGCDQWGDACEVRDELAARPGALSEADREDLRVLVQATSPTDLAWLPDPVPSRETAAMVGAWALQLSVMREDVARTCGQLSALWVTATDVARTLWAYSGGDPGLTLAKRPEPGPGERWRPAYEPAVRVVPPRTRAIPRALRTTVLAHLEKLGTASVAEDMNRHPTIWKRLAERIHPFERTGAFPEAAVAFAALRSTVTPARSQLGQAMSASVAKYPERLRIIEHGGGRVSVRSRTFAGAVEAFLDQCDLNGALRLLGTRPGELWRALDHLARSAGDDPDRQSMVQSAAGAAAHAVAPGVLAAAAAELRGRDATVPAEATATEAVAVASHRKSRRSARAEGGAAGVVSEELVVRRQRPPAPAPGTPRRVFFPRGNVTKSWTEPEHRGPLPAALIAELRAVVDRELAGRAALLDRFELALIDKGLVDVPAPSRARSSSGQLAGWARGARVTLKDLAVLRLFLHWVEPEDSRVDLDLSCAFYDSRWSYVGHCDYTTLQFAGDAAVHSGDFTSAPAPFGATEYLDLDVALLAATGVRYAVPTVFSFTDTPFELLPEGFAGFSLPVARDAQFDGGRVLQRFDLRGDAKMVVPLVLDVAARDVLWVDVNVTSRGYGHRAGRHSQNLGRLGADLWDHYAAGKRPTLLDLAAWHAVGRASRIFVTDFGAGKAVEVTGKGTPEATIDEIRRALSARPEAGLPEVEGRSAMVVTGDATPVVQRLGTPAGGSVVVSAVGDGGGHWQTLRPEDLLAGLVAVSGK